MKKALGRSRTIGEPPELLEGKGKEGKVPFSVIMISDLRRSGKHRYRSLTELALPRVVRRIRGKGEGAKEGKGALSKGAFGFTGSRRSSKKED